MRFLFLLLVVVIAVLAWRRWSVRSGGREVPDRPASMSSENMVQCRVCGIYVPEEESLKEGLFRYCSAEHRDLDTKRSS